MITKGPQLDKKRTVFTRYQTIVLNVHLIISQKMREKTKRVKLWEEQVSLLKKNDETMPKTTSLEEECGENTPSVASALKRVLSEVFV